MNIIYLISQIIGFVAFLISLIAYHKNKKEKIFKTMILGNLLDNALEALERAEHRYLYVEMHYDRGILIIHIENSFDGKVKKRGDTYLTRKDKKDFHGIGMKNIEEIVKKYDGEQEITVSGKRFKTNILLYVSEL